MFAELYRQRQKDSALNNQATSQVEYQQSQERTQIYHEKWQQVKAKKSNKRQRDSSSMTAVSLAHTPLEGIF